METYEKLLDRLYLSLPPAALQKERFELLEADSMIQGQKTIIKNFSQIVKQLRRELPHVMKFLTKELATPNNLEEGRLVVSGKFPRYQVQNAMMAYTKQYVLCGTCGKPDTHFEEREGIKVIKCEACGAHTAIRKL